MPSTHLNDVSGNNGRSLRAVYVDERDKFTVAHRRFDGKIALEAQLLGEATWKKNTKGSQAISVWPIGDMLIQVQSFGAFRLIQQHVIADYSWPRFCEQLGNVNEPV